MYSSKTNLNLVLEFLETDLELIIKDRTLVFLPADIKSWVAMTFRGLEFCHRNFILHRVTLSPWLSYVSFCHLLPGRLTFAVTHVGPQTKQLARRVRWETQDCRFWFGKGFCGPRVQDDVSGYHQVCWSALGILFCLMGLVQVVPAPGTLVRCSILQHLC